MPAILLIEDDPISIFVAMKAIKMVNSFQDIKACKSGIEALEYLNLKATKGELAPELVIFDINLPGINGYEFYTRFQKLPFQNLSKVIFCVATNSTYQDDMDKFSTMGIHEYINKPLTKERIEAVYEKYFKRGVGKV